jgi:Secretion system C-terminal sorting domain
MKKTFLFLTFFAFCLFFSSSITAQVLMEEGFETGIDTTFLQIHGTGSDITVETFAANTGTYGLMTEGNSSTGYGLTPTTVTAAFDVTKLEHICRLVDTIDATAISSALILSFDLKMGYTFNINYSWFRVMINDTTYATDTSGTSFFQPATHTDAFETHSFDLSAYAGTVFTVSLEYSGKYYKDYYYEGDIAYLDNIKLFVHLQNDLSIETINTPVNSFCGSSNDSIRVLVKNNGLSAQSNVPIVAQVNTPNGPVTKIAVIPSINISEQKVITVGAVNTTSPGAYSYTIYHLLATDEDTSNDTLMAVTTTEDALTIPHLEDFTDDGALWNISGMQVNTGHGLTNKALFKNLHASQTTGSANMTKRIGELTTNCYLFFDYRYIDSLTGAATTLGAGDTLNILISDDCGTAYTILHTIDTNNHIVDTLMQRISIPLGSMTGSNVIVGFEAIWGSGNYWLDIDNVLIAEPPVTNIGTDTSICEGNSFTFDAGAGLGNSYLWSDSSSNQTIMVDTSAYGVGTHTLWVVLTDSFGNTATDTASIEILQGITVNLGSDYSMNLTHMSTLDAGSGYANYLWDNMTIAQTRDIYGYVEGIGFHTYYVDVTASNGCMATDTIIIEVVYDVGVDDGRGEKPSVSVFPNPNNGLFKLSIEGLQGDVNMEIVGAKGEIVSSQILYGVSDGYVNEFDLTQLAKGVYYLKFSNKETVRIEKLIIQ